MYLSSFCVFTLIYILCLFEFISFISTYGINSVVYHKCIFSYDFLNDIFFSLAYYIVRIKYKIHVTYSIYINRLFMLSIRLPVNSRLLRAKLLQSQVGETGRFLTVQECQHPNPHTLQGSAGICSNNPGMQYLD